MFHHSAVHFLLANTATTTVDKLVDVPRLLDETAGISARIANHRPGQTLAFSGVWGSIRSLFAAALARQAPHVLMLLPQAADADTVAGDAIAFGLTDSVSLPLSAAEVSASSIRDDDYADRLQVLQRLMRRDTEYEGPLLVTAYIGGAMQLVPTPEKLEASTRKLCVGDEVDPEEIRRWLAEAGFSATTAVQLPGEFATRGGLLDIYSADQPQPIRIEWFGDEIESIRRFDPGSQRSIESLTHVEIAAVGVSVDEDLADPYADPVNRGEVASAQPTTSLGLLTDYLPDDTLVVLVDPQDAKKSADALIQRTSAAANLVPFDELMKSLAKYRLVTATSLAEGHRDEVVDLHTSTADAFAMSLDETRSRIDTVAEGHEVILVGDTPADGERLTELLADTDAARQGRLHLVVAEVSGGFRLVDAETLVLTGAELFHRSPVRRGRSRARGNRSAA